MGLIETLGMQTGGAIIGKVFGDLNDERQLQMNRRLQDAQIEANTRMGRINVGMQKEMWDYTNFENQLKHMKAAGLSPALMYGGSGAGGTTAQASAGSVQSGDAPKGGGEMAQMGMMMASQEASIELMKAQADKTRVEADKLKGVDTDLGKTEIGLKGAQKLKTDEETNLVKENARMAKVGANIAEATSEQRISIIDNELRNIEEDVAIKTQQEGYNNETMLTRIEERKQSLANIIIDNQLKRVGINEGRQRIAESINRIAQSYKDAFVNNYNASTNRGNMYINAKNSMTTEERLRFDKEIHNVSDATKLTVETVGELVGDAAYIYGKMPSKVAVPNKIGFKR
jgi:hypothetical protein